MNRFLFLALLLPFGIAHAAPTNTLDLSAYKLQMGPISVSGVRDNASGLAFNESSQTLFMVLNGPTIVLELDLKGQVKRWIRLRGFSDTEGIAWVGSNTFAVVEEGRGMCRILEIPAAATSVSLDRARSIVIDRRNLGNSGLEGLGYDRKARRFYAIKEKYPQRIYSWGLPGKDATGKVVELWDFNKVSLHLSDLSGVEYHPPSGHLLVLSHESRVLVECTRKGELVGRLRLGGIPQAEGVAISRAGVLYICSEPNLLYVYRKK